MKKIQISPSILSADFSQLKNEIKKLEQAGADMIHVDVMDGHFVPNLTIGPPVIKSLRGHTNLPFDVHLMIQPYEPYLKEFANAGADHITIHYEAGAHLHRGIQTIKELGKKVGVSINPSTNPDNLKYILQDIDIILVMSVNPGFGGQSFLNKTLEKIKHIKKLTQEYNIKIVVDLSLIHI